jgi:threonine/homoserine efflux transporter RhtA
VAGQPAAYSASYSDPCDPRGTSVAWFVAVPGEPWAAYVIIATASGSGNPGQETAIAGIVASVHVIARQLTVMSRT